MTPFFVPWDLELPLRTIRPNTYWGYTSQWNFLDYPAVVFPTSMVDKTLDTVQIETELLSGKDEENWKLCQLLSRFYLDALGSLTGAGDPDEFDGLPISLQLIL